MEDTLNFHPPCAESTAFAIPNSHNHSPVGMQISQTPSLNVGGVDSGVSCLSEGSGPLTRSKRRLDSVDFDSLKSKRPKPINPKKPKKEKKSHDELTDKVKTFASKFPCYNFERNRHAHTLKFDIIPNEKVFAEVDIWKAEELRIRINFRDCQKVVEIVDESFGKWTTKTKVNRLQNFIAHMKRIKSNKEELFSVGNLDKYIKSHSGEHPKVESVIQSENGHSESNHRINTENVVPTIRSVSNPHVYAAQVIHQNNPSPIITASMVIPPGFRNFTVDQHNQIDKFNKVTGNQTIIRKFNRAIHGYDVECLQTASADNKLNDQIINQNMDMLCCRSNKMNVRCLNTHFFPTFCEHGYHKARGSFGESFDFSGCDMMLVPIHLKRRDHWCLAIIWPKKELIELYDSLHRIDTNSDEYIFQKLLNFLKEHSNNMLDISSWTTHRVHDIPKQQNNFDCGVFICVYAEHASRDSRFDFSQVHMPYFRKKILLEICTGELIA